ncbi:hypothetical protein PENTCL1PPCAC_4705, partial [Pristionchus entomophagus]
IRMRHSKANHVGSFKPVGISLKQPIFTAFIGPSTRSSDFTHHPPHMRVSDPVRSTVSSHPLGTRVRHPWDRPIQVCLRRISER